MDRTNKCLLYNICGIPCLNLKHFGDLAPHKEITPPTDYTKGGEVIKGTQDNGVPPPHMNNQIRLFETTTNSKWPKSQNLLVKISDTCVSFFFFCWLEKKKKKKKLWLIFHFYVEYEEWTYVEWNFTRTFSQPQAFLRFVEFRLSGSVVWSSGGGGAVVVLVSILLTATYIFRKVIFRDLWR